MSRQQDSPITIIAGEALAAFRNVKVDGTYADAGYAGIGITQAAAAKGAHALVRPHNHGGTCKITAAGAFSAGATLYSAADGKFDDVAVGSPMFYALEAATADGDIVEAIACKGETDSSALANSSVSDRSRAATAMPTEDIWKHFNLPGMRSHPFCGSLLERDWTHGETEGDQQFADTSSVIRTIPGAAGEGALTLFTTDDNNAAEVNFSSCPITTTGGAPWAFEARLKVSVITDSKFNIFAGLMVGDAATAGDQIGDTGTLADLGAIGFQMKEADGDKVDFVYDKNGQVQNEHDDDYVTPEADTYFTVGMYYNGTTIQGYVNGVATGTAISAADIAAADFPAADVMVPVLAVKAAAADDFTLTCDWIRVAQPAA